MQKNTIFKAFKYRIYPTKNQIILLNKHFGACRYVYNLALETKQMAYLGAKINLTWIDLSKQLTELKKEAIWLKEINAQALVYAIKNVDTAYKNFYNGSGFPKYKSKHKSKDSFYAGQNVRIKENKIYFRKFSDGVNIKIHRPYKGEIKTCYISRSKTGKYFASVLCDTKEMPLKKPKKVKDIIGVDLGLKTFLVTSENESVENPKYLRKSEKRLKYLSRKFSKNKGKKTRIKLAKLHEKVANQRKDFIHKQSTRLVLNSEAIAIENLNIKGLLKNRKLSKSISDVGWGMFTEQLKYKAEWYGVELFEVGRFDPSSKKCSTCGSIKEELKLSERSWECGNCGAVHDRDFNAAINIKNFAKEKFVCGAHTKNHGELPPKGGVMTHGAYI